MPFLEDIYNLNTTDVVTGMSPLKSFIDLDIDADGNIDLNDTGKDGVETMVAIHGLSRSGTNFTPRPFIDNAEYTFGYTFEKNKDGSIVKTQTEKSQKRHTTYIKCIEDSGLADIDPVVAKYLELLKTGLYEKIVDGHGRTSPWEQGVVFCAVEVILCLMNIVL